MLTASGYGITATFDDNTLTIEGNNKAARIALAGQDHADGPVRVAASEITDLAWKSAGRLTNGNLTVTTGSGKRFQMHFLKKHSAGMEALMKALESARTA